MGGTGLLLRGVPSQYDHRFAFCQVLRSLLNSHQQASTSYACDVLLRRITSRPLKALFRSWHGTTHRSRHIRGVVVRIFRKREALFLRRKVDLWLDFHHQVRIAKAWAGSAVTTRRSASRRSWFVVWWQGCLRRRKIRQVIGQWERRRSKVLLLWRHDILHAWRDLCSDTSQHRAKAASFAAWRVLAARVAEVKHSQFSYLLPDPELDSIVSPIGGAGPSRASIGTTRLAASAHPEDMFLGASLSSARKSASVLRQRNPLRDVDIEGWLEDDLASMLSVTTSTRPRAPASSSLRVSAPFRFYNTGDEGYEQRAPSNTKHLARVLTASRLPCPGPTCPNRQRA